MNIISKFTLGLTALSLIAVGCTKKSETTDQIQTSGAPQMIEKPGAGGKLEMNDLKTGTGNEATPGKTVTVHYTGLLTDGKKFDSSLDRNQPFVFKLGAGQVIPGWDSGIVGMKVGGKRKLTIPPQLAYGSRGAGNVIPPDSTLVFEVELLDVK